MSKFTLKIKLPGYKLCLFSLQHHTLELSFEHFRLSKIRAIRNLPKKFKILTLPKPQKCPFLNKKPTVPWQGFWQLYVKSLNRCIFHMGEVEFSPAAPLLAVKLSHWDGSNQI